MKNITAPVKKLNAREPKVGYGGMPSRNTPTYNKACHGSIPAKESVRATVAKVKSAR